MAIKKWQNYFENDSSAGQPLPNFTNLSLENQAKLLAKRAVETDNLDFFYSEDGSPNQFYINALSSADQAHLQLTEHVPSSQRTPVQHSPDANVGQVYSPAPFFAPLPAQDYPPAQPVWDPKQAAFAHEQALQTHREKLKMDMEFRRQTEFMKLHNAALISAVPTFDRQRDTVHLYNFLDKFNEAVAGPYAGAPETVKIQFLETKLSPTAKSWFKGLNAPTDAPLKWYLNQIQ